MQQNRSNWMRIKNQVKTTYQYFKSKTKTEVAETYK